MNLACYSFTKRKNTAVGDPQFYMFLNRSPLLHLREQHVWFQQLYPSNRCNLCDRDTLANIIKSVRSRGNATPDTYRLIKPRTQDECGPESASTTCTNNKKCISYRARSSQIFRRVLLLKSEVGSGPSCIYLCARCENGRLLVYAQKILISMSTHSDEDKGKRSTGWWSLFSSLRLIEVTRQLFQSQGSVVAPFWIQQK